MNKVILLGRATREPEVRYTDNANGSMCIAKFSLAVDRKKTSTNTEPGADFINITAFGKSGEFVEKYVTKGIKLLVTGRIRTDNYTNKDGIKVYTTEVLAEEFEFAESKNSGSSTAKPSADNDGFMNVPEGIDEDLPFASAR